MSCFSGSLNDKSNGKKRLPRVSFNRDRIYLQAGLRRVQEEVANISDRIILAEAQGELFEAKQQLVKLDKQRTELLKKINELPWPRLKNGWFRVSALAPVLRLAEYLNFQELLYRAKAKEFVITRYFGECPNYNGHVMPFYWETLDDPGTTDEHDTVAFSFDDSRFESHGEISAFASLLTPRINGAERFIVDSNIYWELPAPICDVKVECQINISHYFNFTNAASNGGRFSSLLYITHSGENGIIETSDNNEYEMIEVYLDESRNQTYGPKIRNLTLGFNAVKGAVYRVYLNHEIWLEADEGLVEINATLGTHDSSGMEPGRPLLTYVMTPL